MTEKIIQALKKIELLSDLPDSLLSQLAKFSMIRTIRAGETIFCQGEPSPYCFGITCGQVTIQFIPTDKRYTPKTLALLGPGALFGESSLFDDTARTAMAQASQDGELVCITGGKFREWIRTEQGASVPLLMDLLKNTLQRLRQTSSELTVVYGAGRILQNHLPFDDRIQKAVDFVRSSLPWVDSLSVYARSAYWEEFEAIAAIPIAQTPSVIPLQNDFIRCIAESHTPVCLLIPDISTKPILKGLPWENDASLAAIPLYENEKDQNNWMGLIVASSRTRAEALPSNVQVLLSSVGGQFLDELRRRRDREDQQAQRRLQQSRQGFSL